MPHQATFISVTLVQPCAAGHCTHVEDKPTFILRAFSHRFSNTFTYECDHYHGLACHTSELSHSPAMAHMSDSSANHISETQRPST